MIAFMSAYKSYVQYRAGAQIVASTGMIFWPNMNYLGRRGTEVNKQKNVAKLCLTPSVLRLLKNQNFS